MLLRLSEPNDLDSLKNLYFISRQQTFTWLNAATFQLDDFERDTQGERVLVAEVDGAVLGFISLWMADNFIHLLFLHPQHLRQGWGRALLELALTHLGRPARLKCSTQNQRALAFYVSQGWIIESTGESADGPYFLMRKD